MSDFFSEIMGFVLNLGIVFFSFTALLMLLHHWLRVRESRKKLRAISALVRDGLFDDSKDWRESDEVGRVDWLIGMYEAARDEKNMVWEWHIREFDALREIAASTTSDADAVREIAHKALDMEEKA